MFEAIRYSLSNLTNVAGRDSRSTFWFFVLFIVIVHFVLSFGLSIVAGGAMMADIFHAALDGATEATVQKQMFGRMGEVLRITLWGGVLLSLLEALFLVAAFTRRLHDSGKPGWIALLAVVLQLVSIALTVSMIEDLANLFGTMDPDNAESLKAAVAARQGRDVATAMLGWIPMLLVVAFGVMPSSDGANRYGPEPDHV